MLNRKYGDVTGKVVEDRLPATGCCSMLCVDSLSKAYRTETCRDRP